MTFSSSIHPPACVLLPVPQQVFRFCSGGSLLKNVLLNPDVKLSTRGLVDIATQTAAGELQELWGGCIVLFVMPPAPSTVLVL